MHKNVLETFRLDIGVAEETPATTLKSESEAVQGVAMLKQNSRNKNVDGDKELAEHMQFESLLNMESMRESCRIELPGLEKVRHILLERPALVET